MNQVCEICGTAKNRIVRDHDHKTGFIRGLLCDPCNGRLGTYEARQIKPRKDKGRYLAWLNKYRNEIELYLAKEPSWEIYKGK